MNLDRVTITGADDSISPDALFQLSSEFPFVEWGILVSYSQSANNGSPRFPSAKWLGDLQAIAETTGALKLSLHVCGKWVRDLLIGNVTFPMSLLHCYQRVQLNFHAQREKCRPDAFARALREFGERQIIFQFDGALGNKHMNSVYEAAEGEGLDCVALFDVSGGAGILPDEWPKPIYIDVEPGEHGEGEQFAAYHGYAGGLGPQNLAVEIPRIGEAFGTRGRFWIDMETRVRSNADQLFDLEKVRRCLEISQPFVSVPQTT